MKKKYIYTIVAIISFFVTPIYWIKKDIDGTGFWLLLCSGFFAFYMTIFVFFLSMTIKNKTTFKGYIKRIVFLVIYAAIFFSIWYCALNFVHTSEMESMFDKPIKVKIVE